MYELTLHYKNGSDETVARVPSEQEAIRRGQSFINVTNHYASTLDWADRYIVNSYTVSEVEE